jgi:hypothetical protein
MQNHHRPLAGDLVLTSEICELLGRTYFSKREVGEQTGRDSEEGGSQGSAEDGSELPIESVICAASTNEPREHDNKHERRDCGCNNATSEYGPAPHERASYGTESQVCVAAVLRRDAELSLAPERCR